MNVLCLSVVLWEKTKEKWTMIFQEKLSALVISCSYLQRICLCDRSDGACDRSHFIMYITTRQNHEGHFTVHKVFSFCVSSVNEGKRRKGRRRWQRGTVNDVHSRAVIDVKHSVHSSEMRKWLRNPGIICFRMRGAILWDTVKVIIRLVFIYCISQLSCYTFTSKPQLIAHYSNHIIIIFSNDYEFNNYSTTNIS